MFGNGFDTVLKKIEKGKCRIAMNGMIAVQTSGGYKTFQPETGRLTNCNQFVTNLGDDFFYVAPAMKVKRGDIILLPSGPCCVMKAEKNMVTVMNYETGAYMTIAPERHMFMGNLYFYEKIISPMKGMFGKGKMNKMMKFMMLSDMCGGNHNSAEAKGPGSMMQMMLMGSMMKDMDGLCEDIFSELGTGGGDADADPAAGDTELFSDLFGDNAE